MTPPPAERSNGPFFSPLVISVFGIVVSSFAIIVYHFVLVKCCVRRHGPTTTAAQPVTAPPPPTGVDEKTLETIPIFTFYTAKCDIDPKDCAVCLGELEDEDMVRLLPNCKHAFHVMCIDQWFAAQTSCPLCRSPIVRDETNAEPSVDGANPIDDLERGIGESDRSNIIRESSEREQSIGLLRHWSSLVLPPPVDTRPLPPPSLKRSLSMDQSLIEINRQRASSSSCPTGALRRSGSYSTRSSSHFDRIPLSSKWLSSFSPLQAGKGDGGTILRY